MALVDPNANLRDLLSQFQGIAQGTQQTLGAANNLRQQAAQQNFLQNAPGLLAQGSDAANDQLAVQAYAAGDSAPLQTQLAGKQKIAAKKAGLSDEEDANSFDPEDIQGIVKGLPYDVAKKLSASGLNDQQVLEQAKAYMNPKANADDKLSNQEALTDYKQKLKDRQNFSGKFNQFALPVDKEIQSLKDAGDNLKSGKVLTDALALQALAKSISGSTRPLSPQAAQSLIASTLGGDSQKVSNFLQSGDQSVLSPEQRQTLQSTIQKSVGNKQAYKAQHVAEFLSNAQGDYPTLFQGGKPDASVLQRAKAAGLDYSVDSTGQVSFATKPTKTTVQGAPGDGDRLTTLLAKANGIKNAKYKLSAVKALTSYKDKVLPPEIATDIEADINRHLGQ